MTYTLEEAELYQKKATAKFETLLNSKDFENKLASAILDDNCLLCDDGDILKHGLCLSCSVLVGNSLVQKVHSEYEVVITVKRTVDR